MILVVDDSAARGEIVDALRDAGYRVSSAGTFEQAANIISSDPPDVLITELRLGAFNGLHLVIRGQSASPTIVPIIHTEFPDPILWAEAHRLGAEFLAKPVETSALLKVISQRLGPSLKRRTSPRKQIAGHLEVNVANSRASLVDLSYDGFRVELIDGASLTVRDASPKRGLVGQSQGGLGSAPAHQGRRPSLRRDRVGPGRYNCSGVAAGRRRGLTVPILTLY